MSKMSPPQTTPAPPPPPRGGSPQTPPPGPPKILILATSTCAYPGADAPGQAHLSYPPNTFIIDVPSPVVFPEEFYYRCFARGICGIIVMSCGVECPYEGAYEKLAARLDRVALGLKQRGIDQRRLKLCSICTVCTKSFLKEVNAMCDLLSEAPEVTP